MEQPGFLTDGQADLLVDALGELGVGLWQYDHLADRLTYSPGLTAMLGGDFPPPGGATLEQWLARLHPDDVPSMLAAVEATVKHGAPFDTEYRFLTSDDNWMWLRAKAVVAERSEDGGPLRTVGIKSDLTPWRQEKQQRENTEDFLHAAQEEVVEGENLLRTTLEATADGILVLTDDYRMIAFNRRFQSLWRVPEALLNSDNHLPVLQHVSGQMVDPDAFLARVKQLYRSDEKCFDRLQLADGRVFERYSEPLVFHGWPSRVWSFRDVTEKEQALAELQRERGLLKTLVETIPDLVWLKDTEGVYLACNQRFEDFFGARESEILGKTDYDFVDRELADFFRDNDRAAIEAGRPRRNEEHLTFADSGYQGLFETTKTPMRRGDGALIGVLGIAHDITKSREIENALRQSETSWRNLFDSADEAIYIQELDGTFIDVNPAAERIYGRPRDWFVGKTPADLAAPGRNDLEGFQQIVEQVLEGKPQRFEFWALRANGEPFPKEVYSTRSEYFGRPVLFAMARDISDRLAAEQAIRVADERRRQLMDVSTDGIAIIDSQHRIVEANARMCEMLGYTAEEILKLHTWDWEANLSEAQIRERFADLTTIKAQFTTRHRRKDGTLYDAEVSASGMEVAGEPLVFTVTRDISDRVAMENALTESRERLDALFRQAADGIVLIDVNTLGFVEFNDAACSTLGYSREEFARLSLTRINSSYSAQQVREQMDRIVANDGLDFEIEHRHKNGSVREMRVINRLVEAVGKTYVVAIWTDITAQNAAARALKEAEARWKFALEGSGLGVWDWDMLSNEMYFSPIWKAMVGYTGNEFPDNYEAWESHLHPDDRARVIGALEAHTRGQNAEFVVEYRMRHRQGFWKWIQSRGLVIERDEADAPLRMIGVHVDIQDHKQVQEQLAQSQLELQTIIDTEPECVKTLARDGSLLSMNQAGLAMIEADSLDQVKGAEVAAIIVDSDRQAFREFSRQVFRGGSGSLEFQIRGLKGTPRWLETHAVPMRDAAGKVIALLGVTRDVTKRKQAEKELRHYRDHLEELVSTRTRELAEAKEVAEQASHTKSRFLANMSHEIRTPLNAVLGLADIGLRQAGEPDVSGLFNQIRESGRHLLGVINDVLDISKIEAGKIAIEPRAVQLIPAIEKSVDLVVGKARDKGLAFNVEYAQGIPRWVELDSLRLQQILGNLLSNAIKFTEQGAVTLAVTMHAGQIEVAISDSGIGIGQEALKRIFKPFEQADVSTTREYGGSGLGLAISYNLARLMGGSISVRSTPGEGSSFTLRLPLVETASPQDEAIAEPRETASRLAGMRILAAEDVDINRLILEDILLSEGAGVVFAEHGQQVLDLLEEQGAGAFDVVLMDIQMPVMDGYEATRRLCSVAPGLPVIALTAHALDEEATLCREAGMVDRVTKPIDPDKLISTIRSHVAASS